MQRDLDLIRRILLEAERSALGPVGLRDLRFDGHEEAQIAGHIDLLEEGGLAVALRRAADDGGMTTTGILRITWKGHEFLDAARNDGVWSSTRAMLESHGLTVPLDLLMELLRDSARQYLDLFEGR